MVAQADGDVGSRGRVAEGGGDAEAEEGGVVGVRAAGSVVVH